MSQIFEVSGISLDDIVSVLSGTTPPGNTPETDSAQVGSVYYDNVGGTWKKLVAGSGADKWSLENASSQFTFSNITATTVLDVFPATQTDVAIWAVTISSVANPVDKETLVVAGSHNGITAKYNFFSKLKFGTGLPGQNISVDLTGGNLVLSLTPNIAVDIDVNRLTTTSKGIIALQGGSSGSGASTPVNLATTTSAGIVQIGSGLVVDQSGVVSLAANVSAPTLGSPASTIETVSFNFDGAITPTVGTTRWYPYTDTTLLGIYFSVDTAPVSEAITARLKKNGQFVGGTMQIVPGANRSELVYLNETALPSDAITVDIISGVDGSNAYITLIYGNATNTNGSVYLGNKPTPATTTTLGEVIVGSGLAVDANGVLSATAQPLVPATTSTLGGVQVGSGLVVDTAGVVSLDPNSQPPVLGSPTSTIETVSFNFDGAIAPTVGTTRWYPYTNTTLLGVYISVDTAPANGSITARVKKNGQFIGSVIEVMQGGNRSPLIYLNEVVTPNDFITVDILSGTDGANAYVTVVYGNANNTSGSVYLSGIGVSTKVSYGSTLFEFAGVVAPTTGTQKWYPPKAVTIQEVYFFLGTAPLSQVSIQAKVNGVAIGSPIVCDSGVTKSAVVNLGYALTENDYVSFDVVDGQSGSDLYVNMAYSFASDLPIASSTSLGMVKAGSGVSIAPDGTMTVTAQATSGGGSGLQVLTDNDYFKIVNPDGSIINGYKYVTIGAGGDFADIYAFADFINNTSIRSWNCVYAYFKDKGVVTLDKGDVWFTNSDTNGFFFIQGAGVDSTVANGPYSSPIALNVTSIVSSTTDTLVVTVDDASQLYVGGVLAIYPDTGNKLPYAKALVGAHSINAISGNQVTLNGKYTLNTSNSAGALNPISGLSIPAKCNRTTITGANINVTGIVGNSMNEGGFYGISFNSSALKVCSNQAQVLLYANVHFYNGGVWVQPSGYVETWGDIFFGGFNDGLSVAGKYMGWSTHYYGAGMTNIWGNNSNISIQNLITVNNLVIYPNQVSTVLLVNPDIGEYGGNVVPVVKPGTTITVASSWADI